VQAVVVAVRGGAEPDRGVGETPLGGGRGHLGAVAVHDAGKQVDRGRWQQHVRGQDAVLIAVAGGGQVQVVAGAAAGHRDIQQLAVLSAGRDGVAGVGGAALRAVHGAGVTQRDVPPGVVRRQGQDPAGTVVLHL